jgi:hypothetical protein
LNQNNWGVLRHMTIPFCVLYISVFRCFSHDFLRGHPIASNWFSPVLLYIYKSLKATCVAKPATFIVSFLKTRPSNTEYYECEKGDDCNKSSRKQEFLLPQHRQYIQETQEIMLMIEKPTSLELYNQATKEHPKILLCLQSFFIKAQRRLKSGVST